MDTTHEEADIIMIQQLLLLVETDCQVQGITVISEDTDVFILLLHYYNTESITIPTIMESPIKGRAVININKTLIKHSAIIPNVLAAHGLTGCDTVASCYGIGKGTVVKTLCSGMALSLLGDIDASMTEIIQQSMKFMLKCYGMNQAETMSNARMLLWSSKLSKGKTVTPDLCTLPPTDEAFEENVKRAHFQISIWKSAKNSNPPNLDVEKYGWTKDFANKSLDPVTVAANVHLAPDYVLKLINCNCKSADKLCQSRRCSCKSANLPCTLFCSCRTLDCHNTV